MKSLIAGFSIHRAMGLYLDAGEIAFSQVAATPVGLIEMASAREACPADGQAELLERMLLPLSRQSRRQGCPIAVGLPAARTFFATRALRGTEEDPTPAVLLQKALQSQTLSVDEFVVDVIKAQGSKGPMVSMAACRRKYIEEILAVLTRCGVRPLRVEPGTSALARAANHWHRAPRRAKCVLRVFLKQGQGLAVVVNGGLPIAWRQFALPAGRETVEILSVKRTLQALGRHYGIEAAADAVMIHGRGDLHAALVEEDFVEEIGARVWCFDEPALDAAQIAFGLAVGGLRQSQPAFDLSRTLKPRAAIWEIFPWGELLLEVLLMIGMGLLLYTRSLGVDRQYAALVAENHKHACLAAGPAKLERQRNELFQKVDAVRRFLDTRVLWTEYMHDLPARLPKGAELSSLQGLCELEYFGKKEGAVKPKKSFILRMTAPLATDGSVPKEIDQFLLAICNHPLLKRDFPDVQLGDIKRFKLFSGAQPMANFTVVCMPGTATPAAHGGDSRAKKGEK